MCGIVGIIGKDDAAPRIIEGLRRLEYRGYDSAGLATLVNGGFDLRRAEGKLVRLEDLVAARPVSGALGIGHTRWATHGVPSESNAHPHATERVAVVHNGIIENFQTLRDELTAEGHEFATDTDTEVVTQLIHAFLKEGMAPAEATARALKRLEGAFALGIIFAGEHDVLIGARRGAPLAVGHGEGEMFLASDAMALAPFTRRVSYLEEGDWVVLKHGGATVRDAEDQIVEREISQTVHDGEAVGKENYRHFMHKEIHEQPAVIGDTLNSYINPTSGAIALPELPFALEDVSRVTIIACGTSYYAGLVARYWIEGLARVPVEIDVSSEFRYRPPPLD
ncbi:MAG: glutamine--fructose-6-phosphate transaminase (isomerizing), partial [Rhodospirillaceae bacterium]|nr:glutamine--fructose-6-phosphate transaminase (isomerizing) [Rhodospirillaceae bacterium]